MKKQIISLLLVLTIVFTLTGPAMAFTVTPSPQTVYVDGVQRQFEAYSIDGSNYFKLRDIAFVLNGTDSQFSVVWDSSACAIRIAKGAKYTATGEELITGKDNSASTIQGNQNLYIDGTLVNTLSVYNIGGYSFFKLRDLGEKLNFSVDYDNKLDAVLIKSSKTEKHKALSSEEIYSNCSAAVFYIETYDKNDKKLGSGSGFFISSSGVALTNYHVIKNAYSAKVQTNTKKVYDIKGVYDCSDTGDWAVIQINGSGFSFLNINTKVSGGAKIYAIGNPLGLQDTISEGLISNPQRVIDGTEYMQITAAISPGSSGGALINEYGEVIGITAAYYDAGQSLNFAVPLSVINTAATEKALQSISAVSGALNSAVADPIQYLKDFIINNGACSEIKDMKYYTLHAINNTDITVEYDPRTGNIHFSDDFKTDNFRYWLLYDLNFMSSSYYGDFNFTFFVYSYNNKKSIMGLGDIAPAVFNKNINITFISYDDDYNNDPKIETECKKLSKSMISDILDNVQQTFDYYGSEINIGDLGFETYYSEYINGK